MRREALLIVWLLGLFMPHSLWAQSAGIAGVVKDATGAVLPGVTVEASSPALIEKVRTVVTDAQGNYRIIDLRPGTYTTTFTLSGFRVFRREGIELSAGFSATVNAELQVGALEESVTVTGASPVVDIQNVRTQSVLTREAIDTLPTGKTIQGFGALTLGASVSGQGVADVGGNKGDTPSAIGIHGTSGNDEKLLFDGMRFNYGSGSNGGVGKNYIVNQLAVQEVVLELRGMDAEAETGGILVSVVPKDGSNVFNLSAVTNGTSGRFQADNLTDELAARGLTSAPSVKKIYDYGASFGAPIKQSKLWFFTAHRWWGAQENQPGTYFNKNHGQYVGGPNSGVTLYAPDLSRPGYYDGYNEDHTVRLTWQPFDKHKLTIHESWQDNCSCRYQLSTVRAPEAATFHHYKTINLLQTTWTYAATPRLLVQAGATFLRNPTRFEVPPEISPNDIAIIELSTGLNYNAATWGLSVNQYGLRWASQDNQRFSVSYVTGSHALKVGLFALHADNTHTATVNRGVFYSLRNERPVSIRQWDTPLSLRAAGRVLSPFVQDQWKMGALTLNLGLRFDTLHGWAPAQGREATVFVPARNFELIDNIPNWKDLSPRVGAAYDLFGNGKTAVKAMLGRYVVGDLVGLTLNNTPANAVVKDATRPWLDINGDFIPDCNLADLAANGECGRLDNQAFGTVRVVNRYAPDVLEGFGVRPFSWQATVSIQHEIAPGFALNAGYYRTWYGNFTVTVNRAVTAQDFDPYCVTLPVNEQFPGGGGNQLCGFYDVKPAKFGQVDNLITQAAQYGKQLQVYNGFDVSLNARFGTGGLLRGGLSMGRTATDNCYQNARPDLTASGSAANQPRNDERCNVSPAFSSEMQLKFSGVYPLPLNSQLSFVFQNLPGTSINASRSYTAAEIVPSLGRNQSSGATVTTLANLLQPRSVFEDRWSQLDLRFSKSLKLGRARVQGMLDAFNIFNAAAIIAENSTYGAAWRRPTEVLGGRLFKFGVQFDF